jgi:4-amino-4-deoxy-L-arabinose transferase-like glycosyltransferase
VQVDRSGMAAAPLTVSTARPFGPPFLSAQAEFEPAPPGSRVALGLLIFAAVWLPLLAFNSLAPPVDNIEQLTWVRSLEWGYYKHPPLPTWLIWLPVRWLGLSAWTGYVMGAACTLGALGLMWHLLARLRGRTYALVALLAALCITCYNNRLYYYNHEVVLLLLSTASATLCWQAFATRRLRWWLGLGLVLGLGALAKYQIAVTVVSVLVFAAHQHAWRDATHRRGALLAGGVALVVFAPHVAWLRMHDFAPIGYAIESSLGAQLGPLGRIAKPLHWLLDQTLNRGLPALLLLAFVAHSQRLPTSLSPDTRQSDPVRSLLLSWGLVPLLFMALLGVLLGANLQLHWGSPFLLFAVPASMELCRRVEWNRVDWRRAFGAFLVLQGLLLTLNHVTSPRGPMSLRDHHWRAFDAAALAARVAASARQELGGPIRVVSGPAALSGALALQLPERPLVLIDGRHDRSPWLAPDLVQRCGALQIGSTKELAAGRPIGAAFPTLAWNLIERDPAAAPCPPLSVD